MINAAEIVQSGSTILFSTFNSVRYDFARDALDAGRTPHLAKALPGKAWERRHTQGAFNLRARMAPVGL
ncbi:MULTISPECIES: hypothetical protein [unclassified Streptomyces]|uniref:hypothetical protein n=1 Tax=unclassified Streptomyces TaxID=2593676 RepID=UPI003654390F